MRGPRRDVQAGDALSDVRGYRRHLPARGGVRMLRVRAIKPPPINNNTTTAVTTESCRARRPLIHVR
jgi:hypothetical protein